MGVLVLVFGVLVLVFGCLGFGFLGFQGMVFAGVLQWLKKTTYSHEHLRFLGFVVFKVLVLGFQGFGVLGLWVLSWFSGCWFVLVFRVCLLPRFYHSFNCRFIGMVGLAL